MRFGLGVTAAAGTLAPQIEYTAGTSCTAGSWTTISGATAIHLQLSSNFVNNAGTTRQITPTPFTAGKILESTNPAASFSLGKNRYTEYEWSLQLSANAPYGTTYAFRVTNGGTPLDTYTQCPTLSTPTPPPAPVINTFTATPGSITVGQSTTLAWQTTNATSVTINQGIGSVALTGSQVVSPVVTTTYTLTATGAGGTATTTVTVGVTPVVEPNPAPIINLFTVSPGTIAAGESAILTWQTTYATTVSIDQGIGTVDLNSSQTVAPTITTTTYTLTATGAGGTRTSAVTLIVAAATSTPATSTPATNRTEQNTVVPATLNFAGKAFPKGTLFLVEKSEGGSVTRESMPINDDGSFRLWGVPADAGLYALYFKDKDGRQTLSKVYTDGNFFNGALSFTNILVSPTIELTRTLITRGDLVKIVGQATPENQVKILVDHSTWYETKATNDGTFSLLIPTNDFTFGSHSLQAKQTLPGSSIESDFSLTAGFVVSSAKVAGADLNLDGKITITDWSIFLGSWKDQNAENRQRLDLNHDGKVDVNDLSIFLRAIKL